jgi:hypothetical protein
LLLFAFWIDVSRKINLLLTAIVVALAMP